MPCRVCPASTGCSSGCRATATRRPTAAQRPRRPRPPPRRAVAAPDLELLGGVAAANGARQGASGCTAISPPALDPLGSEPVGDPALDPLRLEPKLTPELQARVPASVLAHPRPGRRRSPRRCPRLQETYCGSIAYEIEHICDHEQRVWLRKAIESWRYRSPLQPDEQRAPLRPPLRGRGHGALPAPLVPRPEAVLARGSRRADPDARRVDRARAPRPAPARS